MEKPYWEGKHYAFFSNKECEYFAMEIVNYIQQHPEWRLSLQTHKLIDIA